MHETDPSQVAHRLEKLERENRHMRRGGLALLLVTGTAVLMGQAAPKNKLPARIEAQSFVLVDASGKTRGVLSVEKKFGPTLRLGAVDGIGREVFIHAGEERSGVVMTNDKKVPVLAMMGSEGVTEIQIIDDSWTTRALLGVSKEYGSLLRLNDATKKKMVGFSVELDGSVLKVP